MLFSLNVVADCSLQLVSPVLTDRRKFKVKVAAVTNAPGALLIEKNRANRAQQSNCESACLELPLQACLLGLGREGRGKIRIPYFPNYILNAFLIYHPCMKIRISKSILYERAKSMRSHPSYDAKRTKYLVEKGVKVYRMTNEKLLGSGETMFDELIEMLEQR